MEFWARDRSQIPRFQGKHFLFCAFQNTVEYPFLFRIAMHKNRGGSPTMNPRRRKWSEGRGDGNKPLCPEGMSCPYREEYQHAQEFAHSSMTKAPTSRDTTSSSVSSFHGSGGRLGGSSSSSSLLADFQAFSRVTIQPPPTKKLKVSTLYSPAPVPREDINRIQCHICMEYIDMSKIDSHVLKHTSPSPNVHIPYLLPPHPNLLSKPTSSRPVGKQNARQSLRQEQDEAYEASILAEVLATSKKEKEEGDVVRAVATLPLPPPPGQGVRIKFVLSSGQRVVRAFMPSSSVTHLFAFLLAEGHIQGGGGGYE
ncbi:hypothetical protein EON65_54555, partial [archaeon]